MSLAPLEKKIEYLTDRMEIKDVIARYARSMDRCDKELFMTTFHEGGQDDHAAIVGDREVFFTWADEIHRGRLEMTSHFLGNHLVEIEGNEAHAETYFIWTSRNPTGAPLSHGGGRYIDRLEKRDGTWGIVDRICLMDWVNPSVNSRDEFETATGRFNDGFLSAQDREVYAADAPRPSRDRSDPSYQRPLRVSEVRLRQSAEIAKKYKKV